MDSSWTIVILTHERRTLIDEEEERNILVLVRNKEACDKALKDCEKPPPKPPKRGRLAVWIALIAAAFAAGLATDEVAK